MTCVSQAPIGGNSLIVDGSIRIYAVNYNILRIIEWYGRFSILKLILLVFKSPIIICLNYL